MLDAPVSLLLHQIAVDAIFLIIQIRIDIHLTDVVEQIEVEVLHA